MSLATQILDLAKQSGIMIATAESCTGGMVMAALTDIAGSSAVAERGFVTYTNNAKMQMLGVSGAHWTHTAPSANRSPQRWQRVHYGILRPPWAFQSQALQDRVDQIINPKDAFALASLTTKTALQRLSNLGRWVGPKYVKRHVIMPCKCYWID